MVRTAHIFDLIIIGAGSAGLAALKEARRYSDNVLLIHEEEGDNTCVQNGCIPSKAFVYAANLYDSHKKMPDVGISGSDHLRVDIPKIMQGVRDKRAEFVDAINNGLHAYRHDIIIGTARYETPTKIRANNKLFHCKSSIIATGSKPHIPKAYQSISQHLITSDTLFERKDLPRRMAVVGLGAIGLEMAQAFARLDIKVTAIHNHRDIGVVHDPKIQTVLHDAMAEDMKIWLDCEPNVRLGKNGVVLQTPTKETVVDGVFVSAGRKPNTQKLGLKRIGIDLNSAGVPPFNRFTMQIPGYPIYLAGDVTDERAILHEANDEGRRAAYHALHGDNGVSPRYTNMQIIFTKPEIAVVGDTKYALRHNNFITAQADFKDQGRAKLENRNSGRLHLFADQEGHFRGAEIMAPEAEHLAHFLGLALTQRHTIPEILKTPFYHPSLEEGLKSALQKAQSKLNNLKGESHVSATHH